MLKLKELGIQIGPINIYYLADEFDYIFITDLTIN